MSPGSSPGRSKKRLALKREVLVKMPIFARLGDRGDELFIMLSGKVGVSRGGSQLVSLGTGEHVGEMALIRSAGRSAIPSAEAGSSCLPG